jgi:uncharacterized protein (TIGR03435 family)
MSMKLKGAIALLGLAASGIFGQSTFEVATIKPADPNSQGRYIRMQSVNRFNAKGFTLNALVAAAYSLTPRAISGGPAWADSDRYDILASTPGDVQPKLDEQMAMLRKLLTDSNSPFIANQENSRSSRSLWPRADPS